MTFEEQRQLILARSDVLDEVEAECQRQIEKWGVREHPGGTGPEWAKLDTALDPELAKTRCNAADAAGQQTYAKIAVEETAEALAETDQLKLRAELVQNAAVYVSWIGKIDRDLAKKETKP